MAGVCRQINGCSTVIYRMGGVSGICGVVDSFDMESLSSFKANWDEK
ncbi:hypothetical protein BC643_3713 [Mangrovibacterium diazotrophicum]|uniref:Uncharacterized protein n=1 Tax=Mangrovibacterium diazotrophicum TaxID=1261403 RepID=A0A419VWY4_9BACT|nr:hypothetical protein BC643_3713 [Mangrovibacterium diazotrophicum]